MHLLAFLDLFTDGNDIFPYPFIYLTSEIPSLSYTWSLKRLPLYWAEPSHIGHYTEYPPPPHPQTPRRVVSCMPMINHDEDLLLHLVYIMPPGNCTFGSFLHKDRWTEIPLANNFPQKRDKDGVWLRSGQICLFWKLTFPDIWSFFDWLRASISIFVLSKPTSMSCNSIILLLLWTGKLW